MAFTFTLTPERQATGLNPAVAPPPRTEEPELASIQVQG